MLACHEILESITTAAHGEIEPAVLEAAATEIWENNSFETMADFEAFEQTWEIVAKHDAK
jgi:hypothetical protein|nr:MAG TPA: hypothetical protein [Caudoviricetes sp.]